MKEIKRMDVKMEMFDVGGGFRIFVYEDVCQGHDSYQAVLMKEGYGASYHLWGIPKDGNYDEYIDLLYHHAPAEILRFKLECLERYGDEI